MAKNILQDVMTKDRKSIRRIPMPAGRGSKTRENTETETLLYEEDREEEVEITRETTGGGNGSRWGLWTIVCLSVILLTGVVSISLSGATVSVTPRTATISLNHEFSAEVRIATGTLSYRVIPLFKSGEDFIPAEIEKHVQKKASGQIVIYNAFSEKSQRLIKNTRFENGEGLIFRIDQSLTVPGRTTTSGKMVPGSVEATVYADAAGDEYNIGLSDFTIPGFKSDAVRYKGFYARSKSIMSGGVDGMVKTASPAAIERSRATLKAKLDAELQAMSKTSISEDSVLFSGGAISKFEDGPVAKAANDNVSVTQKAYLYEIVFDKKSVSEAIAKAALGAYDGSPLVITNLESLSFRISPPLRPAEKIPETINFTLSGKPAVVWQYDAVKLRNDFIGKSKDAILTILSGHPSVAKADVYLKPFWKKTFPSDPKKIIIETLPFPK